jgi:hypothetical protein
MKYIYLPLPQLLLIVTATTFTIEEVIIISTVGHHWCVVMVVHP